MLTLLVDDVLSVVITIISLWHTMNARERKERENFCYFSKHPVSKVAKYIIRRWKCWGKVKRLEFQMQMSLWKVDQLIFLLKSLYVEKRLSLIWKSFVDINLDIFFESGLLVMLEDKFHLNTCNSLIRLNLPLKLLKTAQMSLATSYFNR